MNDIQFSKNLKRIIETRNLKLKVISDGTGIPVSTLSEWTNGRQPKVSKALLKLSEFLGMSLDELVSGKSKSCSDLSDGQANIIIGGVKYCVIIRALNNTSLLRKSEEST